MPRSSQPVKPSAFRLKGLHVDPAIGIVQGAEGSVHLEPRVMAVLQALAHNPGELVSRADLLAEIWPGGSVYDEALTQCVYQLRLQLATAGGEDHRNLINTVPKRGYLLDCDVQPVESNSSSESRSNTSSDSGDAVASKPQFTSRRLLIGLLAVVLLTIVAWLILGSNSHVKNLEPVIQQTQTLAVLPFLPLVESAREPALELGMADTLIARLSRSDAMIVRPITSVRRYADIDRDSLRAGRELGVETVVEGSIQRAGETMRVTVRMLRVADGAAVWAATFNESFSNVFSVQDEICERIATALSVNLGQQDRKLIQRVGTLNTEAYDHYLKGRYHLARLTPLDLRLSIDSFHQAVELDPGYAQAWLGLASAQFRIPIAGEAPPKDFYPQAKIAAQTALEIDPSLAEGHAMLGWIAHWFEWDWPASEAQFKRAIELDANDTESHLGYAQLLSNAGRNEQALSEVRRAREISPFYLAAAALEGGFLLRANRPEEALQRLETARQLDESFWLTRISLASVYLALGREEEALTEVREARKFSGNGSWSAAIEISMLVSMGKREDAETLHGEMLQRAAVQYVPPYDMAVAAGALGDDNSALGWLERAYEMRDPKLVFMGMHGNWPRISSRPEFTDLLGRINLVPLPD